MRTIWRRSLDGCLVQAGEMFIRASLGTPGRDLHHGRSSTMFDTNKQFEMYHHLVRLLGRHGIIEHISSSAPPLRLLSNIGHIS